MNFLNSMIRLNLLIVLISVHGIGYAQFSQLPTPDWKSKESNLNSYSMRKLENPLLLPFWDDFSKNGLDSTKWISEGATQSNTIGNSAPSLGVLLLDGVDERGMPYSNVQFEQGFTDRITSQPIDLSNIPPIESETVYISFFWQVGGKGELPDSNDELSLQFLDPNGLWITVWEKSGGLTAEQFFFTQEIIQVEQQFHHDAFQFRFQIGGRRSGPFDSWILDYVFLNKNRNISDLNFEDRALTKLNERPLGKYTAVPLFILEKFPEDLWNNTQNEFKNLSSNFRAMEYSFELREKTNQNIIKSINSNTPFNPVPIAQERRSFSSNPFSEIPIPDEESDYELVGYLVTGDNFLTIDVNGEDVIYSEVDFRINDTVRTVLPLRDFLAYDDGSVDYSAGINQRSGMLATRYELVEPAFLTGISINFTNFLQIGSVIDLMVWNDLEEEPLFVKEVFIPEKSTLNEFSFFEIDQNIPVNGTFYIGFSQFIREFLFVGLDKTYNNGEEIFYNVSGVWQQNETVEGSLMMRPHVSPTAPFESESESQLPLNVYPNPVSDKLYIEGAFENLIIFDPLGRNLSLPMEETDSGKSINFGGLQKGVYLIKSFNQKEQKSIRILVK